LYDVTPYELVNICRHFEWSSFFVFRCKQLRSLNSSGRPFWKPPPWHQMCYFSLVHTVIISQCTLHYRYS